MDAKEKLKSTESEDNKPTTSKSAEPVDELNVSSEEFNPMLALNTPDFRVTHRKPKVIYQNLAALESALNKVGLWQLNKSQATTTTSSNKSKVVVQGEQCQRRFEPHQLTIKRTEEEKAASQQRHNRNVFTYMQNIIGPLSPLQKWQQSQQRVMVIVRNEQGVRGSLEGELKAFDKQWNIVLINVLEIYTRRKFNYGKNNLAGLPQAQDCSKRLRDLGIKLPTVEIKSLNRKNVQVKRHIPLLLLRGEQIVIIRAK